MTKRIQGISKVKFPFDIRHRQGIAVFYLVSITVYLLYLVTGGV